MTEYIKTNYKDIERINPLIISIEDIVIIVKYIVLAFQFFKNDFPRIYIYFIDTEIIKFL